MTVTSKKLAANRANAKKSTGPRTVAGKWRASMNAVRHPPTHNLFCANIVIPGEKQNIFEAFRYAYLAVLRPQDMVEVLLVDRIVSIAWKLRRLGSIELIANRQTAQEMAIIEAEDLEGARSKEFEYFQRYGCHSKLQSLREKAAAELNEGETAEEKMKRINGLSALAASFVHKSGQVERINRYEQRLELSLYRAMRQLERLRTQNRKRSQDPEIDPPAYCPFIPEDKHEELRRESQGLMNNFEGNEPKAA